MQHLLSTAMSSATLSDDTRRGGGGARTELTMHSLPCSFLVVLAYLPPHLMTMTTRISYDEFAMSALLAHSWLGIARLHVLTCESCLEYWTILGSPRERNVGHWKFLRYCSTFGFSFVGKMGSFCLYFPFHLLASSTHLILKILIPGDPVFLGVALACCLRPGFGSLGFLCSCSRGIGSALAFYLFVSFFDFDFYFWLRSVLER